jgi:hypothetical protein
VAGLASRADAGTARVFAQSRRVAISSTRVIESGTVCAPLIINANGFSHIDDSSEVH